MACLLAFTFKTDRLIVVHDDTLEYSVDHHRLHDAAFNFAKKHTSMFTILRNNDISMIVYNVAVQIVVGARLLTFIALK